MLVALENARYSFVLIELLSHFLDVQVCTCLQRLQTSEHLRILQVNPLRFLFLLYKIERLLLARLTHSGRVNEVAHVVLRIVGRAYLTGVGLDLEITGWKHFEGVLNSTHMTDSSPLKHSFLEGWNAWKGCMGLHLAHRRHHFFILRHQIWGPFPILLQFVRELRVHACIKEVVLQFPWP